MAGENDGVDRVIPHCDDTLIYVEKDWICIIYCPEYEIAVYITSVPGGVYVDTIPVPYPDNINIVFVETLLLIQSSNKIGLELE